MDMETAWKHMLREGMLPPSSTDRLIDELCSEDNWDEYQVFGEVFDTFISSVPMLKSGWADMCYEERWSVIQVLWVAIIPVIGSKIRNDKERWNDTFSRE